jgi:hypothetical protein
MNIRLFLSMEPVVDLKKEQEEEERTKMVKIKGHHEQKDIKRYVSWDMR